MMTDKFLIIADDFTGANDTGVQLKRNGIPVKVLFNADVSDDSHSIVIDTESRSLDGPDAFEKVRRLTERIDYSKYDFVIKKVDSTLRGNIAEEIAAIDEKFGSDLILFAPALPDLGRITVNGIHQLNGVRITETEIGRDPKKPVRQDVLKKILESVFKENIIHVSRGMPNGLFPSSGTRIFTFDAETNDDLLGIINAAAETGKRILWAGTAALADNIMRSIEETPPAFAICGSISEVTRRQLHEAGRRGIRLISVSVPDLLSGNTSPSCYMEKCTASLLEGKDTILLSSASYDRSELDRSIEEGKKKGLPPAGISSYTQDIMGAVGAEVLKKTNVSGLFLTGGDTAIGFLQKTHAEGSYILEEIAPGIPKLKIIGGSLDGLAVVTKAGAFGNDDAIIYGMRKLKEKVSSKDHSPRNSPSCF